MPVVPQDSTRDLARSSRRQDDRFISLKRRVTLLARFSAPILRLADGPWFVRIEKISSAAALVAQLKGGDGLLDITKVTKDVRTAAPPLRIDQALVATARRELRALASPAALALAKEHRRALARYGKIDEAWVREREKDVTLAHDALTAARPTWFASVVDLVRARDGDSAAVKLVRAHDDVVAAAMERRKRARERVRAIVDAMRAGTTLEDIELRYLADRLDAARDLPGRARRRRVLDVLRRATQWNEAPEAAVASLAQRSADETFAETVLAAGHALADSIPAVRDPKLRDKALGDLAVVALGFQIGDDGIAPLSGTMDVKDVLRFVDRRVSAAQAVALARTGLRPDLDQLASWVGQGLELRWVEDAIEKGYASALTRVPDVRAARAYATWASRLVPHYKSLGISFSLTPELFAALPKNVDLGVLAVCLLEATKLDDPAAVLDATLGLFAKLPSKATRILTRLKAVEPGAARRTLGEFAEWLGEDELLDRLVHVAKLAGEAQPLTHRIREDFDHAQKIARELAHLESMTKRNVPQEGRLALLRKGPRSVDDAPKGRTRRRVVERVEALMPIAYRRELDTAFREISREAWGVDVPALTPAWRDAVRFWLVVDDNKKLLGTLLKEAAKRKDAKLASAKNREWIAQAGKTVDVEAWLAPRRGTIKGENGAKYTIEVEEDPLEVLRMGIPFGTCLSLEDGCNAASTVLNALDANKRVIYVRGASGKVVARKLLALNEDLALIGYNLYISVSGGDETAIRTAVERMCIQIAKDVGARMAVGGKPAEIHAGFWYDDGVVAFAEDEVVSAYCRAHRLSPPKKTWTSFVDDARGWYATDQGDIDGAIDALGLTDRSISNVILGRWIIEHLGLREATRRAKHASQLVTAVTRRMADDGERGIVRAFDFIAGHGDTTAHHAAHLLFDRAGRSARVADAFVRAAETVLAREKRIGRWGLVHATFEALPPLVDGVRSALALCDRIAPIWAQAVEEVHCNDCLERGEAAMIAAVHAAYEREPDDEAVVACLMAAKRMPLAHRAALHIAARHFLDQGARALRRFTSQRAHEALAASPDGVAAMVRQSGMRVALESPFVPKAPIFEALGPLLFSLPASEIEQLVGRAPAVADDVWEPGPWELAWRRRHPDPARREVEPSNAGSHVDDAKKHKTVPEIETACSLYAAEPVGPADRLEDLVRQPPGYVVDQAIATKLGAAPRQALDPALVAELWQRRSVRDALAMAFVKGNRAFGGSVLAVEHAADRAGLPLEGFFDAAVNAMVDQSPSHAIQCESFDQAHDFIAAAVRESAPEKLALLYQELNDLAAVAMFLRALSREPRDRTAAIRAAMSFDDDDDRHVALKAWTLAKASRASQTA